MGFPGPDLVIVTRHVTCCAELAAKNTGAWDITEMRRYYREVAGFPASRLVFETVKNALFPANRLMYRLEVDQTKAARARWTRGVRDFHDGLVGRGHVPAIYAIDDLFAAAA